MDEYDVEVTNSGTSTQMVLNFKIPKGLRGATGPQGPTTINIASVTTKEYNYEGPYITNTGTSTNLELNFFIPKGKDGTNGINGITPTISIDQVSYTTENTALVTNSGTSTDIILNFVIPKGDMGLTGSTGPIGPTGAIPNLQVGTVSLTTEQNPIITRTGTDEQPEFNFIIPQGPQGPTGPAGRGITSIELMASDTTTRIDTYRINLDNGGSTTFEITNGQDGATDWNDVNNNPFTSVTLNQWQNIYTSTASENQAYKAILLDGNFVLKTSKWNVSESTSNMYEPFLVFQDSDYKKIAEFSTFHSGKKLGISMQAVQNINEQQKRNTFTLGVDENGNPYYSLLTSNTTAAQNSFRNMIGANNGVWPTSMGGTGNGNNINANRVFAGPENGNASTPTFRPLVAADIPNLDINKITSGILPINKGGTGTTTANANNVFIGPLNNKGVPSFRSLSTADIPDLSNSYLSLNGGTLNGNLYMNQQPIFFTPSDTTGTVSQLRATIKQTGTHKNRFTFWYNRPQGGAELFSLPLPSELTTNGYYDILTSKNPVTIAQGGTGAATSAQALTNLGALSLNGGTLNGSLYIKENTYDISTSNTVSSLTDRGFFIRDVADRNLGYCIGRQDTNGDVIVKINARRRTTKNIDNSIELKVAGDNTKSVKLTDPAAWLTALGVSFTTSDIGVGATLATNSIMLVYES